jgi:hypothetical protein
MSMKTNKTWEEFQASGLFWLINSTLHLFGWSIFYESDIETGKITNVYPARVKFRGFTEEDTEMGFKRVTKFLKENIDELQKETVE